MARGKSSVVLLVVIVAIAAVVVIAFLYRDRFWPDTPTTAPTEKDSAKTTPVPKKDVPPKQPPPPGGIKATDDQRKQALALFDAGVKLQNAGDVLGARAKLADAVFTGALDPQAADDARRRLTDIADTTIFSRRPDKDDPCTESYKFRWGDTLEAVSGKKGKHLRVPWRLLQRVNRITDPRKIQAGQRVKLIRGPFHAIISKSRFIMDVYLEEHGTRRMIFVRRMRVGLGADGATPLGQWRIALQGKTAGAVYTSPSSADKRVEIELGEPGYPLGRKGYWIPLEGIGSNPYAREDGYGIHGTNDPSSIGKAMSAGCIRLGDADIELVFSMLYEKWSRVTIVE